VPVTFTMDDDEYGPMTNCDSTNVEPWTWQLFNHMHADPAPDGYTNWRLGDVECLTVDGRRYCDPVTDPNTPAKSKLGRDQKAWLERTLQTSDATLVVIFSGGTFASRMSPDTWVQGWPDEYRELMKLFHDVQQSGRRVLVISGDAHGQRIHHHPDPAGRPGTVTEFICSGLRASHRSMARADDRTLNQTRNVRGESGLGMIVIDPPGADRRITLRSINGDDGPLDLFPPLELPYRPGD
jgi:hypothetical protein